MLTKSVKSVISVVLKHVARAKKSVQSVRSVSDNIRMVSPDSSLCQNGKQIEIITKMIFELCYIEAITKSTPLAQTPKGKKSKPGAYILYANNVD